MTEEISSSPQPLPEGVRGAVVRLSEAVNCTTRQRMMVRLTGNPNLHADLRALLAHPQGGVEPVAWVVTYADKSAFLVFTEEEADDAIADALPGATKAPLYAHPHPESVNAGLVEELRARKVRVDDGPDGRGGYYSHEEPDPLCQRAAEAIAKAQAHTDGASE